MLRGARPGSERRRQPPPFCRPCLPGLVRPRRARNSSSACAGVFQPRVLRGRAFSWRGDRGQVLAAVHRPGRCPWGSTGAAARWCSRCCPAATASAGRRSRCPGRWPGRSGRGPAISLPWSQVSDRRSCRGQPAHRRGHRRRHRGRVVAVRQVQQQHEPGGPLHQRADRRLARPMIRSPSQCPGTARSAASAGRSLIITMPGIWPAPLARPYAAACAAPARSAGTPPAPAAAPPGPARRSPGRWSRATPASPARPGNSRFSIDADLLRRPVLLQLAPATHSAQPAFPASFAVFGRAARHCACACAASAR